MKRTLITLACSIALFSCTKQEPPKQAETPKPPQPVPVAEVTFVKGHVQAFCNGTWSAVAIGQQLLATDSITLAAKAELELKDNAGASVELKGARKGAVAPLLEQAEQARPAKPAIKALSSVKKLEAKQATAAVTPTAVAGIRGAPGRRPMPPDTTKKDTTSHK